MLLSKWSISPQGSLSRKGLLSSASPFRVLYLDDHSLFRGAVVDSCMKPFFTNMDITEFDNGDDAYEFIVQEINDKHRIDLIITDINHPGMRGHELVRAVRLAEKMEDSTARIPIIVLTMVNVENYPQLITDKLIDHYFTKTTEPEDIIEGVEESLFG